MAVVSTNLALCYLKIIIIWSLLNFWDTTKHLITKDHQFILILTDQDNCILLP